MYNTLLSVDGYQGAAELGAASSCMAVVRVTLQPRTHQHRPSSGGGIHDCQKPAAEPSRRLRRHIIDADKPDWKVRLRRRVCKDDLRSFGVPIIIGGGWAVGLPDWGEGSADVFGSAADDYPFGRVAVV